MKIKIKTETISFSKDMLKEALKKIDKNVIYHVQTLIYYPYMFFEFQVNRNTLFHRKKSKAGCTVDGINKIGALVDVSPQFIDSNIEKRYLLPKKLTRQESFKIAQQFLLDSMISRMKILKVPSLELVRQESFYRPYWIVKGKAKRNDSFLLTVDAVTGKYHPI